jgi:hypothetical protein
MLSLVSMLLFGEKCFKPWRSTHDRNAIVALGGAEHLLDLADKCIN